MRVRVWIRGADRDWRESVRPADLAEGRRLLEEQTAARRAAGMEWPADCVAVGDFVAERVERGAHWGAEVTL